MCESYGSDCLCVICCMFLFVGLYYWQFHHYSFILLFWNYRTCARTYVQFLSFLQGGGVTSFQELTYWIRQSDTACGILTKGVL